jgi:hypothetical protein
MMDVDQVRTVHAVADDNLLRDAEGRVVCARCGGSCGEWSPQPGATWYRCDVCGKTVLGVDMLETSEVRV